MLRNTLRHIGSVKKLYSTYRSTRLFGIGFLSGSTVSIPLFWYYNRESSVIKRTKKDFDYAYNYQAKLLIYSNIPEQKLPQIASNNIDNLTITEWANLVDIGSSKIINSIFYKTMNYMKESLLSEIKKIPDINTRLQELKNVIPNSLELYYEIESELQDEINKKGWIDSKLLEEMTIEFNTTSSAEVKLLQNALTCFPGSFQQLYDILLDGNITQTDPVVTNAFKIIKTQFDKLRPEVQKYLLESVAINLLNHITKKDPEAYNNLIKKLSMNEQLKSISGYIPDVFKALPVYIQAKILLTSFKKFDNEESFLKSLINDGGIVAIKLGQILSENTKVPENYRKIFSSFRDSNEPCGIIDFWKMIPISMRKDIKSLGKCVGVGSVKQIHLATMNDDSIKAVALIRKGAEDDAVSTLKALSQITFMKGIVDRIRKMVFKEMDLLLEYESFETLRTSIYESKPFVSIPNIDSVSLRCLIRDFGTGQTLAKISEENNTDINLKLKKSLELLHRCAIHSAFNYGLIMSDLHMGNIAFDYETNRFTIFDPAQNDHLTNQQSTALLWTLAALSDDIRMNTFKKFAIDHLNKISDTKINDVNETREKISECYDKCREIKNPRYRFITLLSNCEQMGINLPNSLFSCAKMIDTLDSQEKLLGMSDIVSEEITKLLTERMTLYEKVTLLWNSYKKD